MTPDFDLLARYAAEQDETAFTELVRRHLDHVYSAALRLVGGDPHLAEDVAQAVFTDLARKARSLRLHSTVSGWLHTSTRFAAANVVRTEQRRRQREQSALSMTALDPTSEPDWQQIRAFLDESIGELSDADRDALMLRFFEKKPLAGVGAALGISEDAARMRVGRAIDKLRTRLASRGVTSTAATLSTVLAQNLVGTAPVTLGVRITASALADAGAVGADGAGAATKLTLGKLAVITTLVLIVATVSWLNFREAPQREQVAAPATEPVVQATASAQPTPAIAAVPAAPARLPGSLKLFFLDADTGRPITNQTAVLRGWERGHFTMVSKPASVNDGRCVVPFEVMSERGFHVLTHLDGYADTRLRWSPAKGETVPEFYTVRLIRPALIHGQVVDTAGRPVAGATVGFNTEEVTATGTTTEDHCIDYLTVKTDANGHWQINRLAPEMVRHLFGTASHPDYSRSEMLYASRQPEVVQQLLNGTAVFRLGEGMVVHGTVLDASGRPVSSAAVRVGKMGSSQSRETRTEPDGSFTVRGCEAGPGLVTAELEGYAPMTRAVTLEPDLEPMQLTLGAGRILRLRVMNSSRSNGLPGFLPTGPSVRAHPAGPVPGQN